MPNISSVAIALRGLKGCCVQNLSVAEKVRATGSTPRYVKCGPCGREWVWTGDLWMDRESPAADQ